MKISSPLPDGLLALEFHLEALWASQTKERRHCCLYHWFCHETNQPAKIELNSLTLPTQPQTVHRCLVLTQPLRRNQQQNSTSCLTCQTVAPNKNLNGNISYIQNSNFYIHIIQTF